MEFNTNRVINLIIRNLTENIGTLLKSVVIVSCILLVITIFENIFRSYISYVALMANAQIAMFIGGAIFSSVIFKEMHAPAKAYRFLTLPVSNLEKLIYAWVLTSPLVVVVSFSMIYLISWLALAFLVSVFHIQYTVLDLVNDTGFGKTALIYMLIQPFFLLGAVSFKKNTFINTVLVSIIIGFSIALFTYTLIVLVFPWNDVTHDLVGKMMPVPAIEQFFENKFAPLIRFLFEYIMAPFVLVITYYKLKEKQIS